MEDIYYHQKAARTTESITNHYNVYYIIISWEMGKMLHSGKNNSFTAIGLDNSGAGA